MAKLSKVEAKHHAEAVDLLEHDVLTNDEKLFVLEHWQESATHVNTTAGAFFTPWSLANDFGIESNYDVGIGRGLKVVDLCAGIGTLSLSIWWHHQWDACPPEITCVELNPDYIAVGRKILPEANWVQASVFALPFRGGFDMAISNPPFGATPRQGGKAPRYTGTAFEYHVIDIAASMADYGVFIIPQQSSGFRYSGEQNYRRDEGEKYQQFRKQTGIDLQAGCGIDTEHARSEWHGVAPKVEIACADFLEPWEPAEEAPREPAPVVTLEPAADTEQLVLSDLLNEAS